MLLRCIHVARHPQEITTESVLSHSLVWRSYIIAQKLTSKVSTVDHWCFSALPGLKKMGKEKDP